MIKRQGEGLLANLWGLPLIEAEVWEKESFNELDYIQFEQVNHIFTHKKWMIKPVTIRWSTQLEEYLKKINIEIDDIQYFSEIELKQVPIATAFKKVLRVVYIKL